jgi:hypothetical protein
MSGLLVTARALDNFFEQEVPSGTVNGSNVTFTLSGVPHSAKSVHLSVNGLDQRQTTDYSISGQTITMVVAPAAGQKLFAKYIKK